MQNISHGMVVCMKLVNTTWKRTFAARSTLDLNATSLISDSKRVSFTHSYVATE